MADTEPLAVDAEQAGPGRRDDGPIVFDESLLIIVKGKVQQPKQPDHTESRLLIQKLQAEITKRGDRIKEIKVIEEQLRSNAKGVSSGNKDVIGKLKELRDQRGTILRQKSAIRDELHSCDGERDSIRAEMRSIRDKNRNVNPEKIDQEVRELEFKLAHESLAEADEKRAQQQVQQLNAARPVAKKYAEFDARLKEGDAHRATIIARLKESDSVLAQLDQQIAAANAVLDEAKAKADAQFADLPTLQVEKKENYEIMVTMRAKIDELRKKNDEEYQDFIKRDRAYHGWKRADARKKYEERQKEREERDRQRQDEHKAATGDVVVEPFSGEIFTCEQLLVYLRSFTAVKEEAKEEAKAVEVPAGLKPFKRAEVVDEMFTGVPKRAPQAKGGKGAAAAAAAPAKSAEPAKPKAQKLNHTLDMLKVFLGLNVDPPTSTSGIPATIEAVEARLAEYKDKQEAAKRAPPPKQAHQGGRGGGAGAGATAAGASNGAHKEQEEVEEEASSAPAEEAAEEAPAAEASSAPAAAEEAAEAAAEPEAEPKAEPEAEPEAPAAPAAADGAGGSAGGVDVRVKVDGNKVSLSVRAA